MKTDDGAEPLLLDTHVWVWAVNNVPKRVHPRVLKEIERAARDERLLASAVSAWELALLVHKRRLVLARPLGDWLAAAQQPPGARVLPLTMDVAVASVDLPGLDDHADPADRFLIATARSRGARLVTCDERLLRYGATGNVLALDARA
ncbi:MAG: type II toxin-antitoxin system VapC family toxin [Gemmatimonadaceae bacterium]